MKKLAVALFVALLGFAFTAPAFAVENQFGGYWRVRMFNQTNFDGDDDTRVGEIQRADTRTRLYYTAKLNDNLKFVNKFEMDAVWGGGSYGNIGADGVSVEVKNSYVDFNLGAANIKMGTQPAVIHRAFLFDDDFSGVVGGIAGFTGLYGKVEENGDGAGEDSQVWHAAYAIGTDAITITPQVTYFDAPMDNSAWFVGVDLDGNAAGISYWGTFIYEGGEWNDNDIKAYLLAAGGSVALGDMASINFEGFYATGDDDDDNDLEAFWVPAGQAYYWAEIMGLGIFDNQVSNGSPGGNVSNITALNVGVSVKPMDKLKVSADLWYAMHNEDVNGEDKLGTEIDLKATYTLVEGLNVDLVAAYLFADDATNGGASDDANPYEIGTRFSISF